MFENVPDVLTFRFISGSLYGKLTFIPMLCGVLYTLYCHFYYKEILIKNNIVLGYIIIYILILGLSLFFGLQSFCYYNDIPDLNQITNNKLAVFLSIFDNSNLESTSILKFNIIMFLKGMKDIVLEVFWNIGSVYLVYVWYRNDWKRAKNLLIKGVMICSFILSLYFTIELLFLCGIQWAKDVLIHINYFLHASVTSEWGWPPVLWYEGSRLVFDEPSFMGNYLPFLFPILWWSFLEKKSNVILFFIFFLSLAVFMSNSRTCYAIFVGMIVIFIFLLASKHHFCYLKQFTFIIGITFLSFCTFVQLNRTTVAQVIDNNLMSIASFDKRSNGARYAIMKANLRVFEENILFGVGKNLSPAYAFKKYNEDEKTNPEIARWIKMYNKEGPFGKDVLNNAFCEYITRLVETGLLGTFIYILPFIFTLYNLIIKINDIKSLDCIVLFTALIGALVSGFNVSLNLVWIIWIITACSVIVSKERIQK